MSYVKSTGGSQEGKSRKPYDVYIFTDGTTVYAADVDTNVIAAGSAADSTAVHGVFEKAITTTAGVRIARYDKATGTCVDGKVIWPFITAKELSADEVWWLTQRIYGLMEM